MYSSPNSPPWRGGTKCRGGLIMPPQYPGGCHKSDLRRPLPPPLEKEAWVNAPIGGTNVM